MNFTGVIGHNISYSLSPIIHNYWYRQFNINGVYLRFDIAEQDFDVTIKGLFAAGCKGVNVTIPFKQQAFDCAEILTPEAQKASAVNCLYRNEDRKLVGHNTDGIGLCRSLSHLDANIFNKVKTILIIGAGGAARGIISTLLDVMNSDYEILIFNRTTDNAEKLAQSFKTPKIRFVTHLCRADLVIQTTPALLSLENSILRFPKDILNKPQYIVDINYKQKNNIFLSQFSNDIRKIDGLEMLLQQASPAFGLFNHAHAPEINDSLRNLLLKSL